MRFNTCLIKIFSLHFTNLNYTRVLQKLKSILMIFKFKLLNNLVKVSLNKIWNTTSWRSLFPTFCKVNIGRLGSKELFINQLAELILCAQEPVEIANGKNCPPNTQDINL